MAECDWIVLCDYAFLDARGKLCQIGIFDAIYTPNVPAKHERSAITFSIIGEPGEDFHAKLEVIGPTGEVVSKAEFRGTLPDEGSARGLIELRDLLLKELGRHAIQIDFGDGVPKAAWFTLRQLPAKP
jgi:hypothetical protein